jgi:hypothetical protein
MIIVLRRTESAQRAEAAYWYLEPPYKFSREKVTTLRPHRVIGAFIDASTFR